MSHLPRAEVSYFTKGHESGGHPVKLPADMAFCNFMHWQVSNS